MGNCVSFRGEHEVWGEELVSGQRPSTVLTREESRRACIQLGLNSSTFLNEGTRDGVQLLLRPTSTHQSPRSSFKNSVDKPGTPCPRLSTGTSETPQCQSSMFSYCKPSIGAPCEESQDLNNSPSRNSCSHLRKAAPPPLPVRDVPEACFSGRHRNSSASTNSSPYQLHAQRHTSSHVRRDSLPLSLSPDSIAPSPIVPQQQLLRMGPRPSLTADMQPSSKTTTLGSLKSSLPPTPSRAASMTQQIACTKASTSVTDDTAHEDLQGRLGNPASGKDLRRCKELSAGSLHSSLATSRSPCFEKTSSPRILPSPFEQQWPAETTADCVGSMAEDPATPRSNDWTSMHMAMAVAAELGEDMPPSSMDAMDKVAAISAAQTHVSSSGCLAPCCVFNPGSSRLSHAGSTRTTPSRRNSNCSSSTKCSPAAKLAQLGSGAMHLSMDGMLSHSPFASGKLAAPKLQVKARDTTPGSTTQLEVKDTNPGVRGLANSSISDPQVPLPSVLSSSLYLPSSGLSNGHGKCGPTDRSAAALPLPEAVVHKCTLNAAQQQQQQQEYGVAHARAHSPVVSVGTHAQGRRASVHSQPLPQLSPEYSTACGCASSPEVARDGHERFALQGFFRPHAAATKCIQGLP